MPSTITAYTEFVPSTLIKSSQVNNNFSNHRGSLLPVGESTITSENLTYDIGKATKRWLNSYISKVFLGQTSTSWSLEDATTTGAQLNLKKNGTSYYNFSSASFTPSTTTGATIGKVSRPWSDIFSNSFNLGLTSTGWKLKDETTTGSIITLAKNGTSIFGFDTNAVYNIATNVDLGKTANRFGASYVKEYFVGDTTVSWSIKDTTTGDSLLFKKNSTEYYSMKTSAFLPNGDATQNLGSTTKHFNDVFQDKMVLKGGGQVWYQTSTSQLVFSNDSGATSNAFGSDSQSEFLTNESLLTSTQLPTLATTTSLFAWHMNGVALDLTNWVGDTLNLLEVGTITSGTNHLGNTTYCNFTGSSCVYASSSEFDTANEAFTVWAVFNTTNTGKNTIASKFDNTNANNSFDFYLDDTGLRFQVYYDASGNAVSLIDKNINRYRDGYFHFVSASYYDLGSTGLMILEVDGNIVDYTVSSNLGVRNNSTGAELTFGGSDGSGTPANFFTGQLLEFGYYKERLTFNEKRKFFITGRSLKAYTGNNSRLFITGENGPLGKVSTILTASFSHATGTFTSITSTNLYIPKDGKYRIYFQTSYTANLDAGNDASIELQVIDGTNVVDGMITIMNTGNVQVSAGTGNVAGHVFLEGTATFVEGTNIIAQIRSPYGTTNYVTNRTLKIELIDYI
jgi:hypothetical protein